MSHARAAPSATTFTIKPIRQLLERYVQLPQAAWIDPFAGDNPLGLQWTNDHNPTMPTLFHKDAEAFCIMARQYRMFDGVLFDPPYSYRQISEHYKFMGMKASQLDTSTNFYNRVMNAICDAIVPGGYAISFGWNSNGFGKARGFQPIELLVVAHGSHHNDTLCLVEQKQ